MSLFDEFFSSLKKIVTPPKPQSTPQEPKPSTEKMQPSAKEVPLATPASVPLKPEPPKPKKEKHNVTGISHYKENVMKLASENEDYLLNKKELIEDFLINERIYQYDFFPTKVELIEEPTNEFDKNAVMVVVDGVHIGYIKKGSCSHIKKLLKNNAIKSLEIKIYGGKYKAVYGDEEDGYEYDKSEREFGAVLEITLEE